MIAELWHPIVQQSKNTIARVSLEIKKMRNSSAVSVYSESQINNHVLSYWIRCQHYWYYNRSNSPWVVLMCDIALVWRLWCVWRQLHISTHNEADVCLRKFVLILVTHCSRSDVLVQPTNLREELCCLERASANCQWELNHWVTPAFHLYTQSSVDRRSSATLSQWTLSQLAPSTEPGFPDPFHNLHSSLLVPCRVGGLVRDVEH